MEEAKGIQNIAASTARAAHSCFKNMSSMRMSCLAGSCVFGSRPFWFQDVPHTHRSQLVAPAADLQAGNQPSRNAEKQRSVQLAATLQASRTIPNAHDKENNVEAATQNRREMRGLILPGQWRTSCLETATLDFSTVADLRATEPAHRVFLCRRHILLEAKELLVKFMDFGWTGSGHRSQKSLIMRML